MYLSMEAIMAIFIKNLIQVKLVLQVILVVLTLCIFFGIGNRAITHPLKEILEFLLRSVEMMESLKFLLLPSLDT